MKKRRDKWQDGEFDEMRRRMVEEQLCRRDITNQRVLDAMGRVPRHLFVSERRRLSAYRDGPLEIGCGQTISQPYIVASMTQHLSLRRDSRVLEIGTGCGYQTAVLAELCDHVFSVEVIPELLERARRTLRQLGYERVHTALKDGSRGWPEEGPFDGIIVTAAAPRLPPALTDQLTLGGVMIIPLSTDRFGRQFLVKVTKETGGIKQRTLYEVRFVPMVGEIED
jgi:protein-L-isoaspartate(D-aspartate) O-methyltransferase